MLTAKQARELLDSIDISTLVGLRDRALIAVMTYALARVGAVVSMRVEDYYPLDKRWWVRLHEKGGKMQRRNLISQPRFMPGVTNSSGKERRG